MSIFVTNYSVTGDCSNTSSGAVYFDITGTSSPYLVQCISCGLPTSAATTSYSVTGLSAGTYFLEIVDAVSTTAITAVYISSGTCVSIDGTEYTSCGLDNGSLTASTSGVYGTSTFYLYNTLGFVSSATSLTGSYIFSPLSPDFYYVIADDGGGCTGQSETCLIKSSTTFSFGLYVINDSPCLLTTGAIYVTGQTGTPPYTYLWSNGGTGSSITGLTAGSAYTVTVTDSLGCSDTLGTVMGSVPALSIASFITTSPTCFTNDGTALVTVLGGTPPYYYSGSNGSSLITYSNTYTFTGLSAGLFSVFVQDAGLCTDTDSAVLLTPGGFVITSISVTNSTCNNIGGSISISLFGGGPSFTYVLTDSSSNSTTVTTGPSYTFTNLDSDTYTLTISNGGPCTYTDTFTVNNVEKFTLTLSTTGTTCGLSNGVVELSITSGGTAPYTYQIDGNTFVTSSLSHTFSGLSSGSYTATVTDSDSPPCPQILPFNIATSTNVDFILVGTDSLNGSNGTVQALVTDGNPPFTLSWSSNVNGQTGFTVSSLSAGTYSLTITDSDGCVKTKSVTIDGFVAFGSYQIFNICDDNFTQTGQVGKKGPQQYLVEGFYDLTSGDTNCILNQSIFELITDVDGVIKTTSFYTGTSLNDFPFDNVYYDLLEEQLQTYPIIGQVLVDVINNKITIITDCNVSENLEGVNIDVFLKITYDISCVSCD